MHLRKACEPPRSTRHPATPPPCACPRGHILLEEGSMVEGMCADTKLNKQGHGVGYAHAGWAHDNVLLPARLKHAPLGGNRPCRHLSLLLRFLPYPHCCRFCCGKGAPARRAGIAAAARLRHSTVCCTAALTHRRSAAEQGPPARAACCAAVAGSE